MDIEYKRIRGKKRGVFALKNFKVDDIIEICPVIVVKKGDKKIIDKTDLIWYYFDWLDDDSEAAIVLGYGSLYNHSYTPNAEYWWNYKKEEMTFKCLRPIKKGEEITTNYNGDPEDQTDVGFKVVRQKVFK